MPKYVGKSDSGFGGKHNLSVYYNKYPSMDNNGNLLIVDDNRELV